MNVPEKGIVYDLDGTTGAPTDSLSLFLHQANFYREVGFGDSAVLNTQECSDSVWIWCEGTKADRVDRFGRGGQRGRQSQYLSLVCSFFCLLGCPRATPLTYMARLFRQEILPLMQ